MTTAIISLALLLSGLLFFVGGYCISSVFYFNKHQVKYSLFRMFPYEFNYPSSFKNNIYGNIAFIIGMLGIVGSGVFCLLKEQTALSVTNIVIIVLLISSTGLICFLFFMPLYYLRTHMIVSSLMMVLSMAIPALISFNAINQLKVALTTANKALSISALVISVLLAIAMLLFTFNPKATYKIYLEKAVDENGQEKVVRPHFIPMAFNEWLSIIIFALSPIGIILLAFIK